MKTLILSIRNRYHPLFHLRKFRAFQALTHYLDVPYPVHFNEIRHPVYVSLTKNLSSVLSSGSAGEERERKNFARLVKIGGFKTFYDVGSNIGLYGFTFLTLVPNGTVHMFEPDFDNARLIRKTLTKSKFPNIHLVESAVSDVDGKLSFFKDDISGATGALKRSEGQELFISRHHNAGAKEISVPSLTLDNYSGREEKPDFIKIDVEGAETSVFRGAVKLISETHPAIFFECDDENADLHRICRDYGYSLFNFETLEPISKLCHNNLALHTSKHSQVIAQLTAGDAA